MFAFFIECGGTIYICATSASIFCFLIATCFMQMAVADDILLELIASNKHYETYGNDSNFSEKVRAFLDMQRVGRQLNEQKNEELWFVNV